MELLVEIGTKLKALRLEKGVTLREVSVSIDSSESLLSKYERGSSEPGLRPLKKLSDYYNVSLDYLLGFTEERQPDTSLDKLTELFSNLTEVKKREVIRYIQFINEKED